MGNSKFNFFVMELTLLIVFLGSTLTVFRLKGVGFMLELVLLLGLLAVGFIALIPAYNNKNAGWAFLGAVCFIALLNLLVIYHRTNISNKTTLLTALFAAFGFFLGMATIKPGQKEDEMKQERTHAHETAAATEEPTKTATMKATTAFTPGKLVASTSGTTYHKPSCGWAKRIKKARQVWFDSEKDAKKKYKPHSCLTSLHKKSHKDDIP